MSSMQSVNGAIHHQDKPGRIDFLFRVSLKAVILNEKNEVLVVKERGRDWWDIPGGGIDHGEAIKDALQRELREEVAFSGEFEYEPVLIEDPHYLDSLNLYQMRVTFLITPDEYDFQPGVDGDEVAFIDPLTFKDSTLATERKIYEYAQLAKRRLIA